MIVDIDMRSRRAVVVGGGKVAFRKCTKLKEAGADVLAVAKSFLPEFDSLGVALENGRYDESALIGAFLVVAATDDPLLNARIAQECDKRGILCDCAAHAKGSVAFTACFEKGGISVGVSTGGADPGLAKRVRDGLCQALDDCLDRMGGI